MKIIVTTCPKYECWVPNFMNLFKRFWGNDEILLDMSGENEKWSDQLIRILKKLDDKYFILLHEDFYLIEHVNRDYLDNIEKFVEQNNVDRFSLQSVFDGYQNCSTRIYDDIGYVPLFKLNNDADYICSFEASIFKKDFLLKYLVSGEDAHECENNTSARVRDGGGALVLVPQIPVAIYKDAVRGGKSRIRVEDGIFQIIVQEGDGEDVWKDLGITI